ncbi:MAG: hypothetical protein QM742_00795 [Aquabacterium sp.]
MSNDHGRHITVRRVKPAAGSSRERPSFDRPSLFAQYDNADVEDADIQRVHILSTLESERRSPQKGPKPRPQSSTRDGGGLGNWQARALVTLMGVGIVALMAAFALLVADHTQAPQPPLAQAGNAAPPARKPIPADTRNPLAALATHPAPPPAPLPPQEQAAVIENLPLDPMPPVTAPLAHQPAAQALADKAMREVDPVARAREAIPPDTLAAMPSLTPVPNRRVGKPDVPPATPAGLAPLVSNPAMVVVSDKAPPKPAAAAAATQPKRPRADKDDDVALLEAVMAHSGARKPPPPSPAPLSVKDALQRCAPLTGGAAATCQARICVQHPSAPECHPEP